ncbi:MAG TPA: DUF979 domain-containing protein [Micropepsaceae bacterium]|nr:DUF979 domain-containing protein [Micropepsaceae bacterium]
MIGLSAVYVFAGIVFVVITIFSALDRANPKRAVNALFWGLLAASFLFGDLLGDFGNGLLVLALAALAGFAGLGLGQPKTTDADERKRLAREFKNRLFVPALAIPAVTLIGSLTLKYASFSGRPLFDPAQVTLIALVLAVVASVALSRFMLRQPVIAALEEGRRLLDLVSWTALLPQMLASLGAVFALAGLGTAVGNLFTGLIPADSRFAAVAAYTIGMAVFTVIMGNGYAAFPVMTAAIGLPLIVTKFGGNPAIMSAIGMVSGFCGTLATPMAANFNLVPVALLGISDPYAVIKAQLPTAFLLLAFNTVLMDVLVFR